MKKYIEKVEKEEKEKPKEKKEKVDKVENDKIIEIRKGINRIKDVAYLRQIIDEWNGTEKGQARIKTGRRKPIRNTENITRLKEKIISNKMYEDVKIKIPPVVERKKMTAEEKAQKATEKKAKDALEKPILTIMLGWKQEFKDRKKDGQEDRKSTRLNSSHLVISYAVFCLKKKNKKKQTRPSKSILRTTNDDRA